METPDYYLYTNSQFTPQKRHSDTTKVAAGGGGGGDHFIIEDLLDFPNDDVPVAEVPGLDGGVNAGGSTESSTVTVINSCNSSFTGDMGFATAADAQFSNDLCVPYDDLVELEWLSNFVEESFSSEDLQKLELISGVKSRPDGASETHHCFQPAPTRSNNTHSIFNPHITVPSKARSKRSRVVPCNWTSHLLSPTTAPTMMSSESESDIASSTGGKKKVKILSKKSESDIASSTSEKKTVKILSKKKEVYDNSAASGGDGRKCLHCATDKTPQWRTGPLGPKTLCNACGVRYKSGRLVPEYRPAASPTFVLTKHSNSHRKVLELRRQKEMQRSQQPHQQMLHQPNMMFEVVNSNEYLIHQHIGSNYRQLL